MIESLSGSKPLKERKSKFLNPIPQMTQMSLRPTVISAVEAKHRNLTSQWYREHGGRRSLGSESQ